MEPERLRVLGSTNALVADKKSDLAIVVTHPWGVLGGNLRNNVVVAVVRYFQSFHVTTVRFDFVGSQIGRGRTQVTQLVELCRSLIETTSTKAILLVGYSYGSLIANSASALIRECVGVVNIAPPFGVQHWLLCFHSQYHFNQALSRENLPRLFVMGDQDNFTSCAQFQSKIGAFQHDNTTGTILKAVDHFFHRQEANLINTIEEWLLQTYNLQGDMNNLQKMV